MIDLRAKKHLVLNAFPLQDSHRGRGIGRYTYRLYSQILDRWEQDDKQLTKAFSDITVVGAANPSLREVFDGHYQKVNFVALTAHVEKRNLLKYLFYKWQFGPKLNDFLTASQNPTIYFLPRHQILTSAKADYTVTMVHDFAPLRTKRWGKYAITDPLLSIEYFWYITELKKAGLIITNSTDTSTAVSWELKRKENIQTILLGNIFEDIDPKEALQQLPPYREPYFFYYGGYDYNKNIGGIIKAFASFIRKHEDTNHTKLVFSGGTKSKNHLIDLAKHEGILENIVLIDHVSDEELARYIVHSLGLFRLSFVEGCGLPEIEVLSLGVPVLSADIGAVREMVSPYAFLIDPYKPELAEPYLYQMARKRVPSEQLKQGRVHGQSFTWSKTATETINAIIEYAQSTKPKQNRE
ncbi:glycosyltransferase [bacterium]|nr:glycosyltransferase [bacterium]